MESVQMGGWTRKSREMAEIPSRPSSVILALENMFRALFSSISNRQSLVSNVERAFMGCQPLQRPENVLLGHNEEMSLQGFSSRFIVHRVTSWFSTYRIQTSWAKPLLSLVFHYQHSEWIGARDYCRNVIDGIIFKRKLFGFRSVLVGWWHWIDRCQVYRHPAERCRLTNATFFGVTQVHKFACILCFTRG